MPKPDSDENRMELEQAEAERERERVLSNSLIASVPGILYLFDDQGRFVRWNENFERVSGYTATEIAAMRPTDFIAEADRELIAERIQRVFVEGRADATARFLARDGTQTLYYFTGERLQIEGRTHLIGVGVDISARERAEMELRARNEELTRFNQAIVGRELRMIELKQEVNELRRQAGLPPRYRVDFAEPEPRDEP